MNNRDKLITSAMTAFLALATSTSVLAAPAEAEREKCYAVVKAGMNDCATATASCAGSSTKDNQGDAFIFVPKGLCEKLVGGRLNPENSQNK